MKRNIPASRKTSALAGWLFSILRWPSPETTEWFCLRTALWWVLQLAPCLHLFAVNAQFDGLKHYGPEGDWQAVMAALLLGQALAVCLGNLWMRVGSLVCFSGLWAFFAGLFWASSPRLYGLPRNTGIGIYASLAVDCMVVAIHLVTLWWIDHLSRRRKASEKAISEKAIEEAKCPSLSS